MAPFKIQVVGTTANKIGEVAGSNPVPATRKTRYLNEKSLRYRVLFCPDITESLCYSLPFSQTQARRRGGGGGTITQHRGLSINAPAGD